MRKTSTLCAMCQPKARKRSGWECRGKRQCRTLTGDEFFHFRSIIILYLSLWVHEGHIRLFKQPKLQPRWPIQLSSGYWITGLFPIPTSDMMLRTLLLITRFWMVPGVHKSFSVKEYMSQFLRVSPTTTWLWGCSPWAATDTRKQPRRHSNKAAGVNTDPGIWQSPWKCALWKKQAYMPTLFHRNEYSLAPFFSQTFWSTPRGILCHETVFFWLLSL